MEKLRHRALQLHTAAVFILGLGVYLFTLSPGVIPGRSAFVTVRAAELEPVTGYANPLYYLAAKAWLAMAGSIAGPAMALNLFSALCGALALTFFFRLVSAIPHDRTSEEISLYHAKDRDSIASAWLAVLAAMFSAPMWIASTRAYENTFGLCILLGTLLLLLRFKNQGGVWLARILALSIGLGCNEISSMVMLFPLLVLVLGYLLLIHNLFSIGIIFQLAGCILLGGCFSLVNAWIFMQTDMYNWAGFSSYMEVVRVLWRDQGRALVQSVPRIGWMIVLFMTIIPLLIIAVPKRAANYAVLGSTSGSILLHLVLLGTSLCIIWESPLSPWRLFRDNPMMLSPYLMASAVFGYVAVYWMIVIYGFTQKKFIQSLPKMPLYILAFLLTVSVIFRNGHLVDRQPIRFANFIGEQVVEEVGDDVWLVAGGLMNSLLVAKASQMGRDLKLIHVNAAKFPPYTRYLNEQLDSDRYRSLLQVGLFPLIQEMLTDKETGFEHVMTYNLPQLYRQNELLSVPKGAVYAAAEKVESVDLDELFEKQGRLMKKLGEQFRLTEKDKTHFYIPVILRHLSQSANNLGVLAWDLKHPAQAEQAFNWALEINPDNASALLNRVALGPGHFEEDYKKALQAYVESNQNKQHLWNLSAQHGYVIDPEAFAQEGLTWALSGNAERSLKALQTARQTFEERADLQWLLSNMYASQGNLAASRKELESLFTKKPDSPHILLALARLEILDGSLEEARALLVRLKKLGELRHEAEIELALLTALEGDSEKAQTALMEITRLNSDDARGWLALAAVSMGLPDSEETVEKAIERIMQSREGGIQEAIQFARLIASRGDFKMASQTLAFAIAAQPLNVPLLEYAVQIDHRARNMEAARRHVEQLLSIDSRNAVGNRVSGSIQTFDGFYALAESSYRISMESEPHPDSATDLAWLLQRRGAYREALELAQQAVAMREGSPSALHTRGLIYYRLGKFEKAKEDLLDSLALWVENPFARLYLAMVHTAVGELDKAKDLMASLEPVRLSLPEDIQEEMIRLNTEIIEKSTSG